MNKSKLPGGRKILAGATRIENIYLISALIIYYVYRLIRYGIDDKVGAILLIIICGASIANSIATVILDKKLRASDPEYDKARMESDSGPMVLSILVSLVISALAVVFLIILPALI